MEDSKEILITQQEAAALLGVSMPTYYKIIKNPDFPLISIGRRRMVHKKKMEEWLQSRSGKSLVPRSDRSHYYSCVKNDKKCTSEPREEFRAYDRSAIVKTIRGILDDLPGAIVQMSTDDFRAIIYKRTGENVAATIEKFGRMINALIPSLMEFDGIALERPRRNVRFYKAKTKEAQYDNPN